LLDIEIPPVKDNPDARSFTFKLNLKNYRRSVRQDERYLLRSNLIEQSPETLWRYTQALPEHQMILDQLKLKLPQQPKPKIYAKI